MEIENRKIIRENPIFWNELAEVDQESEDAFQRAFLKEPRFDDRNVIDIKILNPVIPKKRDLPKFSPLPSDHQLDNKKIKFILHHL